MARMSDEGSAGQSGSSVQHGKVLDANTGSTLTLPGHEYVTDAQILRDGQDLILRPAHGEEITIQNYFAADPAPVLTSGDGASLTPDLVDSFVKPIDGVQYAQSGTMDDSSPIGVIKETSGEATVTHTNGTVEKAAVGTPIYEGDIVETKDNGAVNITFVDKTTFAVSENAKMAIDQYVFDPATQHGENNFSVLRGVFVFTSGLIGHSDPDDVKIDTPVGSIGIRGTTIMGTINPGGDSHVSVVEGAIVINNAAGETTLSQQFETVKLTGMNQPMTAEGVLSAEAITANYNVLRTVSGPLFSTFDDLGKGADQPAAADGQAPAPGETAPAASEAAPINKSDAGQPSETPDTQQQAEATLIDLAPDKTSTDSGFDTSAGITIANVFSNDTVNSTALTGSTATTTLASSRASTTTPAPVANTASTNTATQPATPTASDNAGTVATGNSTTNGQVLPPLALAFISSPLTTASLVAGTVVATVQTTMAYTGVTFAWANMPVDGNGYPLFTLASNGPNSATLTLTTAGAAYLNDGDTVPYNITATLPDGRTTTGNSDLAVRDPAPTPPAYDLLLNTVIGGGAGGTFIPSVTANSQHGYNTTALGDYNHDGRADYAFTNNLAAGSRIFIDDGFGNNYQINTGGTPFNINDTSRLTVASAGDFNRDGRGDIIIGAFNADQGGQISSGTVFIASGANPGGTPIAITGFTDGQFAGFSVSGAGDFNGDGFADIIIGAPETSGTGHAYLLFGRASMAPIDVSALSPSQGFVLSGTPGAGFGSDVTGVGDFNNDGFDDFAVSSPGTNSVSIQYGNAAGTATAPLTISGFLNTSKPNVVAVGDVNGDGVSDIGIYDDIAGSFMIFHGGAGRAAGTTSTTASNVTLHGASGTTMIAAGDAGDFNGDGRNDMMVAMRNGSNVDIYVVYGSGTLAGSIDVTTLANTQVFHMSLDLASTQFNLTNPTTDVVHLSLNSSGDLNNDGFDDLMIGIANIDSNGGAHSNDGGLILVQGRAETGTVTVGNNVTAIRADESLLGTAGSDTLGNGTMGAGFGGVRINSGGGSDVINLYGNATPGLIDGGTGHDTLVLRDNGANIDLMGLGSNLSNIETINMNGSAQVLRLTLHQVFDLLHQSETGNSLSFGTLAGNNSLIIDAPTGGSLATAGFTDNGVNGSNQHVWTSGAYTLLIDADITVTVT